MFGFGAAGELGRWAAFMTMRRITDEDDPETIHKLTQHYESFLKEALAVAASRVKRASPGVKQMVQGARLEGLVPGYKYMSVAFPKLSCNHRWYANYPWSILDEFTAEEFADFIIGSAKDYVRTEKKKKHSS